MLGLTYSISGSPPSSHCCLSEADPPQWSGGGRSNSVARLLATFILDGLGPLQWTLRGRGPAAVDGAYARSASLPTGRCWCGDPWRRWAISYFSSYSWECAVAMDGAAAVGYGQLVVAASR